MVMRFNFERQRPALVERHDTGVVLKNRKAAAVSDGFGGAEDGFLKQTVVMAVPVRAVKLNRAAHRFVAAMLRPRLRDRFKLDVFWLAAQLRVMLLDRFHF